MKRKSRKSQIRWCHPRGFWTAGFYGRLPDCSSLNAELWSIYYHGLKIVLGHEMFDVEIESDSEIAIKMVKDSPLPNFHSTVLVEECKQILQKSHDCSIVHSLWEGDRVTEQDSVFASQKNFITDHDNIVTAQSTTCQFPTFVRFSVLKPKSQLHCILCH
ncbi:hypothetical protein Vadar_024516 [Vaccinium darrowii]|uniref:Uncharacterized protein n=1 Tax=Vaccinium darrowii TaxID=229202 RepID=A0ACB7XC77_9ERIC|nr:hypothetical protein Vadar_024516 [Vaccinium darrowii]